MLTFFNRCINCKIEKKIDQWLISILLYCISSQTLSFIFGLFYKFFITEYQYYTWRIIPNCIRIVWLHQTNFYITLEKKKSRREQYQDIAWRTKLAGQSWKGKIHPYTTSSYGHLHIDTSVLAGEQKNPKKQTKTKNKKQNTAALNSHWMLTKGLTKCDAGLVRMTKDSLGNFCYQYNDDENKYMWIDSYWFHSVFFSTVNLPSV